MRGDRRGDRIRGDRRGESKGCERGRWGERSREIAANRIVGAARSASRDIQVRVCMSCTKIGPLVPSVKSPTNSRIIVIASATSSAPWTLNFTTSSKEMRAARDRTCDDSIP